MSEQQDNGHYGPLGAEQDQAREQVYQALHMCAELGMTRDQLADAFEFWLAQTDALGATPPPVPAPVSRGIRRPWRHNAHHIDKTHYVAAIAIVIVLVIWLIYIH